MLDADARCFQPAGESQAGKLAALVGVKPHPLWELEFFKLNNYPNP